MIILVKLTRTQEERKQGKRFTSRQERGKKGETGKRFTSGGQKKGNKEAIHIKAGTREERKQGRQFNCGLRVNYLYVPDAARVLLLDIYHKDETDDLAAAEKRQLAVLAQAYREEVRRVHGRKGK